jgi:hypothetical protein
MERSATFIEEARLIVLMRQECPLRRWLKEAIRDNDDCRPAFLRASRATRQVLRILDQEARIRLFKC